MSPRSRGYRSTRPPGRSGRGDRIIRDGGAITSAARTIPDAAAAGTAPEQIELAVVQAVERGQALPDQLGRDAAERGRRVATLIEGAFRKIAA